MSEKIINLPIGWERKTISDLAEISSGGTPSTINRAFWNGRIQWCTPTDITANNKKYIFQTEKSITKDGLKNSGSKLLPKGTLLLCSRATIGEISIAKVPMATNQGFKNLICYPKYYSEFLYYAILPSKPKMYSLATGSTFLEISKQSLAKIEILIPKEKAEQKTIAEALSDVDNLIEATENRIEN